MPVSNSPSRRTFSRHVAPFAPLALALLMSRAVLPPVGGGPPETEVAGEVRAEQCDDVLDFQDCHTRYPTGCSSAGKYDAYLNLLKNQLIDASLPSSKPVAYLSLKNYASLDDSVPEGLKKGNHLTFKDQLAKQGEGQIYGVTGYLYYATKTGPESSNCQLGSTDDEGSNVDYHIGIGFDGDTARQLRAHPEVVQNKSNIPKNLQQTSVIVEMTPHSRYLYENGIWTVQNLQKAIGHEVRVIGQLINDSEHNIPSQNCAIATTVAERKSCWRASAWELHPVIRFQVCGKDSNDCTPEDSRDWVELDQFGR